MNLENSQWLIDMRRQGEKPAEYVTVSMVGPVDKYSMVVPDNARIDSLDVRYLVGLDVNIAHVGKLEKRMIDLANKIHMANVNSLFLWNVHNGQWINVAIKGEVMIKELRRANCQR